MFVSLEGFKEFVWMLMLSSPLFRLRTALSAEDVCEACGKPRAQVPAPKVAPKGPKAVNRLELGNRLFIYFVFLFYFRPFAPLLSFRFLQCVNHWSR